LLFRQRDSDLLNCAWESKLIHRNESGMCYLWPTIPCNISHYWLYKTACPAC